MNGGYWVLDAEAVYDSEHSRFVEADKRAKELGGLVIDAEGLDPDDECIDLTFNTPLEDYRPEF